MQLHGNTPSGDEDLLREELSEPALAGSSRRLDARDDGLWERQERIWDREVKRWDEERQKWDSREQALQQRIEALEVTLQVCLDFEKATSVWSLHMQAVSRHDPPVAYSIGAGTSNPSLKQPQMTSALH